MRRAHLLGARLARRFSAQTEAVSAATEAEVAAGGPSSWTAAATAGAGAGVAARYAALVQRGTLVSDPHQAACVERLEQLSRELAEHTARVAAYQQEQASYERQREALQGQLLAAEEAALLAEEQAGAAGAASSKLGGMRSWLSAALSAEEPADAPQRRSPAQRRAVARARVERQLDERVGPPPSPPPPPKGVYLHGSVGSGKSLLMDLLSATVHQARAVPHQRRLHFNSAMLELHSRMHAIERHRMNSEEQQMDAYAAAVRQQRRGGVGGSAAPDAGGEGGMGGSSWQQILRLDPIAQQLQRSKLAKMAFRRVLRDKMSRSASEQSSKLAASNASILRHAARALIRNCDTLELMGLAAGRSSGSTSSSSGSSSGGGTRDTGLSSSSSSSSAAAAPNNIEAPAAAGDVQAGTESDSDAEGEAEVAIVAGGAGLPAPATGAGSSGRIAALLCFDEMQIADTFSAVALKGLLEALVAEGCVVVATSNRAPSELDSHGLNELMFNHLIDTLHLHLDVVPLNAQTDYRRLMAATAPPLVPLDSNPGAGAGSNGAEPTASSSSSGSSTAVQQPHPQASYFYPLCPAAAEALEHQWQQLALAGAPAGASSAAAGQACPTDLPVMFGRTLRVERARGGAAWFRFEELCARPLGPADYLAISQAFHTVFLEGVPALSMQVRDQARRFITLVDELYNHRARLVCSAAAAPDQLFAGADHEEPIIDLEALQFEGAVEGSRLRRDLTADGGVAPVAASASAAAAAMLRLGGVEEKFAFARAVSRLYEMQSPVYLDSRPRA